MPNHERMPKSEARNAATRDDFSGMRTGSWSSVKRPEGVAPTIWKNVQHGSAKQLSTSQRQFHKNPLTNHLISQLVGAGTSVSANYAEADDSVSKKDFLKSIGTCRKEARETKHFLRMVARAVPELKLQARELWMEAKELN